MTKDARCDRGSRYFAPGRLGTGRLRRHVHYPAGRTKDRRRAGRAGRRPGLARPDQFFGGIDGEPEGLVELQIPDSPYKACVSLAYQIFGYALGQQAAAWIEGRCSPKATDVLPYLLTTETLPRYTADIADPGAIYADAERLAHYLKFYGYTCTDSHDAFVTFPCSSEGALTRQHTRRVAFPAFSRG